MTRRKNRLTVTAVAIVFFVVLMAGGFAGILSLSAQQNWNWPGIGITGISGSNGGPGSTSGTGSVSGGTGGGTGGGNLIPPNQVGIGLQIVADYSDGSSAIIGNQNIGPLPTLTFSVITQNITVNGKRFKDVTANAVVAVSAPTPPGGGPAIPLPLGSLADFKVNFTATNRQTHYQKWNYLDISTNFVNGTLASIQIPGLAVLPWEAFSTNCNKLPNGTATCTGINTGTSHTVDWAILAGVIVSTPAFPQFAILSGTTSSSAQFTATGQVTACTECGGTPPSTTPPAAPIGTTGGNINGPNPNGPPNPPNPPSFTPGGCITLFPVFCITNGLGGANNQVNRLSSGSGVTSGGGCFSIIPFSVVCAGYSLLPDSTVPVPLSASGTTLVNPMFLAILLVLFTIITVIGSVVIWKLLSTSKRRL
jgi:hypothetical protein